MSKAVELSKKYMTLFKKYGVTTPKRKAMFFAQLDHESGLKPTVENLNYSATRLLQMFPKYFSKNDVDEFAGKPEKIANRVYANRMGNGNQNSGDGWKYRGRGFIQLTGRSNYTLLSKDTGVYYVGNPDLLLNEADSMVSALWFWQKNRLNELADWGDVEGATRVINGGLNGLEDRKFKYDQYLSEFS